VRGARKKITEEGGKALEKEKRTSSNTIFRGRRRMVLPPEKNDK